MTRRLTGLALAVLAAIAGCGKDEAKPEPPACTTLLARCDVASSAFCMDICNAIMPTDETDCTNAGGTWTAGAACSTANLQGTCTVANPTPPQVIAVRFYTSTWSDPMGQSACTQMGGTYTP